MNIRLLLLSALIASPFFSNANTWLVGPARTYTKPSQVASLVQNGDTVLIDAGVYTNNVARWTANNLLIRGVGGLAHLKSGGNVYGGKAIWVIVGNDVTVENIEFSEAACPDLNGAGIRSEGINLTVRGCYFHDNENGILAGDISSGDILIEHCEFKGNGYANGLAHNLYINHAKSLIFRYNYSHDAKTGHELKSRAYNNFIYCNRISDENGTASRSIDLPNGGFSIIMGNVIVQDLNSENNNLVGYGMEGLSNPNSELYVVYNTFVNNKNVGSFIQLGNGTPKLMAYNNLFAGPGTVISGTATILDTLSNRYAPIADFKFVDPANYNFHLKQGSIAIGIASNAGMSGGYSLSPMEEYAHPNGFQVRPTTVDAGAFGFPIASETLNPAQKSVSIFPNPAHELLHIVGLENEQEVSILGFSGNVLQQNVRSSQIDVRNLPIGMYWLHVQTTGNYIVLPFVKL